MAIKRTSAALEKRPPPNRLVKHPQLESSDKIVVRKGDTLGALAKKHGVSLKAIKAANPSLVTAQRRMGDLLFPGDEVILPPRKVAVAAPSEPATTVSSLLDSIIAEDTGKKNGPWSAGKKPAASSTPAKKRGQI